MGVYNTSPVGFRTRPMGILSFDDAAESKVRSKKAAHRVKQTITRFIEQRLKLKISLENSAVNRLIPPVAHKKYVHAEVIDFFAQA